MADVATYVELCTRLSRFVQLQPTAAYCEELQGILYDLVVLYDRVDLSEKRAPVAPIVGFAAMDDLVLLSLHKLLGTFILSSSSLPLQEQSFKVFTRVLRRSKSRMRGDNLWKTQRRLSFVQSCVLFLPPPPEAGDTGEDVPGSLTITSQPEELRLAVLESLRELLQESEPKQELLLQTDQQHFFAYVVASLLHVAQRDRCREAALQAVEVLKCVLIYIRDPNTLRQYLPGVAAGLWKSANAPQQTSRVIVAALECLASALNMCIGDDYEPSPREKDQWLDTTAMNLDLLFSRMFAAGVTAVAAGPSTGLPRSSWRVRRALAQLCGIVMLQCRRALRVSFFRCYDELLVLHGDAIEEVAQEASKILEKLQMSVLSSEERLKVLPEMADRFQMLLSTLVLKVATEHEATKVHLVRTLCGYLTFLGSSLTTYLDASMESIYTSLCRVVSFAALDIELVVHQTLPKNLSEPDGSDGATAGNVVISQFQKRLRFFNEEASVREVLLLLREVGAIATPAGFIDCAFTLLSETDSAENGSAEIVLVLNEFLRAYCPSEESTTRLVLEPLDIHLVGRILDDLLALDVWKELKAPSNNGSSRLVVSQRALMVECVGVCAEILGAEFKAFLLHVLYPLVEQLGSHSIEVERAALAALEKVYFFTGYESLEALFEANMDYFVDSLCSRLEQLDEHPMTAFVVEALLRHTRLASLPLVDEVASSLLRSVDLYQDSPYVDGLLRALKALLGTGKAEKSTASRSLLDNFINEMKVLESDGIDAIEIEDGTDDKEEKHSNPEEMPDVKGAMPLEYDEIQPDSQNDDPDKGEESSGYRTVVIDIMDRCGYFLVDSDPIACCLVLSLIDEGVQFLSHHQKQLLPLVARMWPELLPRLRVENRTIVTGTVRVITTLAETAGDFVGDRFVETVWPILRSQIQSISFGTDFKSSQLTRSMLLLSNPEDETNMQTFGPGTETEEPSENELSAVSGGRKTQEIRQILAILSCLTMVCQRSETVTQLVPEITRTCSKYLSRAAPQEIVEQTSTLFAALVQLNGDEVFCTVAALASWEPPTPPSSRFSSFEPAAVEQFYRGHLSRLGGPIQYCRENARILMTRLFN
eukprot:jgi/Phyca11/559983/estExt2_Genewise1.C_PHYCAscaffold_40364